MTGFKQMGAQAWTPSGPTEAVSANSSASASQALAATYQNPAIRVNNSGASIAFITAGKGSGIAADTAGIPIGPGAVEIVTFRGSVDHVAALTVSGSASVYFTPGEGI